MSDYTYDDANKPMTLGKPRVSDNLARYVTGLPDYTHDEAMRDIERLRAFSHYTDACDCIRCTTHRSIAAYIKRLKAENKALRTSYQDAADFYTKEIERLEAENADILWRRNWLADRLKATEAERNEWEAVARWLADHIAILHYERRDDNMRGLVEWRARMRRVGQEILAAAQKAVRHE